MFSSTDVVFVINSKSLKGFEDENVDEFENVNFISNNNVNILNCSKFADDDRIGKFDLENVILVNEGSYFRKYWIRADCYRKS